MPWLLANTGDAITGARQSQCLKGSVKVNLAQTSLGLIREAKYVVTLHDFLFGSGNAKGICLSGRPAPEDSRKGGRALAVRAIEVVGGRTIGKFAMPGFSSTEISPQGSVLPTYFQASGGQVSYPAVRRDGTRCRKCRRVCPCTRRPANLPAPTRTPRPDRAKYDQILETRPGSPG